MSTARTSRSVAQSSRFSQAEARRRRRNRPSVREVVERCIKYEQSSIAMFQKAAERAEGTLAGLFRRLAEEEKLHFDFFKDWYHGMPQVRQKPNPDLEPELERAALRMTVEVAQLPEGNDVLLDFVMRHKLKSREFYVWQHLIVMDKMLRMLMLDIADEEHMHINELRAAASEPQLPHVEADRMVEQVLNIPEDAELPA